VTLTIPSGRATFEQLHRALRIAFGWATTHTYDFKVKDPDYKPEEHEEDEVTMIQRLTAAFHRGRQSRNTPRENLLRIIAKPQGEFGAIDNMHSGNAIAPSNAGEAQRQVEIVLNFRGCSVPRQ